MKFLNPSCPASIASPLVGMAAPNSRTPAQPLDRIALVHHAPVPDGGLRPARRPLQRPQEVRDAAGVEEAMAGPRVNSQAPSLPKSRGRSKRSHTSAECKS